MQAAFLDPWESTPIDTHAYEDALREERRGQRPMNLRPGNDETNCGNCAHYDPHTDQEGICGLYTYAVDASQLCDFWESAH